MAWYAQRTVFIRRNSRSPELPLDREAYRFQTRLTPDQKGGGVYSADADTDFYTSQEGLDELLEDAERLGAPNDALEYIAEYNGDLVYDTDDDEDARDRIHAQMHDWTQTLVRLRLACDAFDALDPNTPLIIDCNRLEPAVVRSIALRAQKLQAPRDIIEQLNVQTWSWVVMGPSWGEFATLRKLALHVHAITRLVNGLDAGKHSYAQHSNELRMGTFATLATELISLHAPARDVAAVRRAEWLLAGQTRSPLAIDLYSSLLGAVTDARETDSVLNSTLYAEYLAQSVLQLSKSNK